ncbi:MAG: hypothetical protein ACKOVA_01005, partial [Novosphingobium sp.]
MVSIRKRRKWTSTSNYSALSKPKSRGALDQHLISTVFQPIYHVVSGRIAGVESLSRFVATPPRSPDLWFKGTAKVGIGVEFEVAAIRLA